LDPSVYQDNRHSQITGIQKIGELMGADMYVYMDIGAPNLFIVRARSDHQFVDDEKVLLTIDMQKALFFDKDTTENLLY
jgi:multiple sugar transport system ATP-binding protein